jgi:hypothetical protein
VRQYRDDWISRVKTRKDKADELAVLRLSGSEDKEVSSPLTPDPLNWAGPPPDQLLFAYLETLPPTKRAAKEAAQSLYDTGITRNMSEGSYLVAETFEQMWLRLAKWFPPNHFGSAPADYWSEYLAQRGRWHRVLLDREGPGSSGTSASVYSAGRVMNDADLMIIQTVEALVQGTTFDLGKWITRWNGAEKEDEKLGRQLDDLFAEGVKIRNRLLAPMTSYDDVGERKVMNDWSDRVVRKLGDAGITIGPISRFRTLDRFEAKTMGDPSRSSAQVHLEAIMNEKLDRLRAIIDTSDR